MLVAVMEKRNRIKDILDERGLSIYWLAKATGMSYQTMHSLVSSDSIPPKIWHSTVKAVSEALGVPMEDLEE